MCWLSSMYYASSREKHIKKSSFLHWYPKTEKQEYKMYNENNRKNLLVKSDRLIAPILETSRGRVPSLETTTSQSSTCCCCYRIYTNTKCIKGSVQPLGMHQSVCSLRAISVGWMIARNNKMKVRITNKKERWVVPSYYYNSKPNGFISSLFLIDRDSIDRHLCDYGRRCRWRLTTHLRFQSSSISTATSQLSLRKSNKLTSFQVTLFAGLFFLKRVSSVNVW